MTFRRWSRQDSIMLRSEHSKRRGDDWIIANGEQQDELMEASHKASHRGLLQ